MPISARKLAASFWEHYGGHKLDQAEEEPCDQHASDACQARRPLSPAPLNMPVYPPTLVNCQTPGTLKGTSGVSGEERASETNMASSQAATLVNVLHRVRSVEESQSRSTAMVNKFRLDMENATSRVRELEFSHKSTLREINSLLQRFGEQMAISRRNEQEKVRLSFLHLREEMEEERNTCRLLQMQNKKLTDDLTHANITAADACEELNRERKARELLEEVCNELAREIGEDKAEVEQLKQEQEESRERLEKELKLMRMEALWREEKVRSKLAEAKLELEYNGEQGMPLDELRRKLEVSENTAAIGTCSVSQEETNNQADQTKLLTQAPERVEHEKPRGLESNMDLDSVPTWLDAHFLEERVPFNTENQLHNSGGNQFHVETDNTNGIEQRLCVNGTRKHRKSRRRLRISGQQGQNMGFRGPQARVYDAKSSGVWEAYCGNSAWPSSEDEPDRRRSTVLQNCAARIKVGLVSKGEPNNAHNLHGNANLGVEDNIEITHATHERKPSMFSSLGKNIIPKTAPSHLESLSNDARGSGSPKKYSLSARFEVGKLGCKSEADRGPSIHHSFSEDDASSYIASRAERGRKQDGGSCLHMKREEDQAGNTARRNDFYGITVLKSAGGGDAGSADDSELDDFYFEPVRGSTDALHSKQANGDEDGVHKPRPERIIGNCGDDACCGVMAKCSQVCREFKADDKAGCITVVASPNAESNIIPGGPETMNKMSPWRSTPGKPLQCLWPPSPDAFSIFGGSKRRGKAESSAPMSVDDDGGLHLHAQRHASPAKQALHQVPLNQKPDFLCTRSNSLGAQLIKARVCDTEKPPKTSFRFSPLRRATSHG